eukprot:TRINITY_DN10431_c0_g1_i1.p1 TRINITY_DN10431_c0_g1~~TRINITY_DN10431_c0_g1_i1.p1  ORF type:complete len:509 (+),score=124.81 TRINITY_DN10431_c0_g1_i1:45-1529(+)
MVNEITASHRAKSGEEMMLPLVRLRVDYTGFSTVNPQRFGQKFVGKVASPHDILLFTKSSKKRAEQQGDGGGADLGGPMLRPEELNQQSIEALLNESNLSMEVLAMQDLGLALHDFVNKDDKMAFHARVKARLEDTQSKLLVEDAPPGSGNPATAVQDESARLLENLSRMKKDSPAQSSGAYRDVAPTGAASPAAANGATMRHREASESGRAPSQEPSQLHTPMAVDDDDFTDGAATPVGRSFAVGAGSRAATGAARRASSATSPAEPVGRGRGRGSRGGKPPAAQSRGLKQSLLLMPTGPSQRQTSQRAAAAVAASALREEATNGEEAGGDEIASDSDDEDAAKALEEEYEDRGNELSDEEEEEEGRKGGKKRAAPKGRGRGAGAAAKRGRISSGTSASAGAPRGRGAGSSRQSLSAGSPGAGRLSGSAGIVADDEDEEEEQAEEERGGAHGRRGEVGPTGRLALSGSTSQSLRQTAFPAGGVGKWGSLRKGK